jgi:pimeloyl-ACP methyl ester carboxylesterase
MMQRTIASLTLVAALGTSAPAQTPAGRTRDVVRYGGVAIEVIQEGRGPLIVLLPSLGRDSEEFDPIAAALASAGFRVVRPRPRGFGQSVGPMQGITLHDFARDVAEVIRRQKVGPALIVGHAYGHLVARATATDSPISSAPSCCWERPRRTSTRSTGGCSGSRSTRHNRKPNDSNTCE